MNIEVIAILVPVIAAIVGAAAGYLGAILQRRHERNAHLDDLAIRFAEKELELAKEAGYKSRYGMVGNWLISREILARYESLSTEERKSFEEVLRKLNTVHVLACLPGWGSGDEAWYDRLKTLGNSDDEPSPRA